jgi:preprotein translocase subunit Sec61beta
MAEKRERTYMPAGIGGLIRYQEEEEPLIKIKPNQLIYIVIVTVAILLAVRFIV